MSKLLSVMFTASNNPRIDDPEDGLRLIINVCGRAHFGPVCGFPLFRLLHHSVLIICVSP